MLISPTVSEVGYKIVGKQHFTILANFAKRVLPEQLTQDSPAADLNEPITAWIGEAERIMNWRNQLLHAVWMIYAEQQTATVLRRAGDTAALQCWVMTQPAAWSECYEQLKTVCEQFDAVMTARASAKVIETNYGEGTATVAVDFVSDQRPVGSQEEQRAWRDLEAGFLSSGFIAEPSKVEPTRESWRMTIAEAL
jgi:hypothetical protein